MPFSLCLGSSRRVLIYFLTFTSLPPTHLVVLVLLVHVIKTPLIRFSPPFSATIDATDPCTSFGICVWVYTQHRTTVDLSWPGKLGTSDTPVIIHFFLNSLAGVPFSPASFLGLSAIFWEMMLGGLPSAQPRNPHLPVFALPFGIGSFASSLTAWLCHIWCGR